MREQFPSSIIIQNAYEGVRAARSRVIHFCLLFKNGRLFSGHVRNMTSISYKRFKLISHTSLTLRHFGATFRAGNVFVRRSGCSITLSRLSCLFARDICLKCVFPLQTMITCALNWLVMFDLGLQIMFLRWKSLLLWGIFHIYLVRRDRKERLSTARHNQ
jgi:hypothetical protein